jgi:ElaB/YqjD/DUF883 family membrane-anchored ribosome-binding protein
MNVKAEPTTSEFHGTRGRTKRAGAVREIRNLIADVEELMSRLIDAADPEITRLRGQITKTAAAAKASLSDGISGLRDRASSATHVADEFVRDRRWQVIGVTALAAAALGVLATRRRTR